MKKKLFIRNLEKRKSSSQLFVSPVHGSSHDTSMHEGGRSFKKQDHGHPTRDTHRQERNSWKPHHGKHKNTPSDPIVSTTALGEEGSSPIVKYAGPEPKPTVDPDMDVIIAKYGPPNPKPTVDPDMDVIIAKYGPPNPKPTVDPDMDVIIAKYGPPNPTPTPAPDPNLFDIIKCKYAGPDQMAAESGSSAK